ncbi:MMPL family transporter [Microbacterium rhizomatis]|uniref:MMPL family transporter n=1 Tax=Microbacterium rhizomatis TaxID=1631477 RepID=A0A5J5J6S3_9MICO|nr:MMPL family transporter [Microbacterium rhizomatis]KAA9111741.1 MMPL family transporter [Microbacterium rhizomatis]
MSTLLYSLGRWAYRRPWRVISTWVLLLILAGSGAVLFSSGTDNAFTIPGTESSAGIEQLNRTFPQASGTSAQIVVVAADGSVTDEAYKPQIEKAVTDLGALDQMSAVTDPFGENIHGLVSDDGSAAIVRMQFAGQTSDITAATKADLASVTDELSSSLPAGAKVALGGDLYSQSVPGVSITEAIGLLIALMVLIVTFRSFVVAGLPLMTAILGVGLSMALILFSTAFATISSTTPLLALMLGLAVGIDYSLFIIARHQDQVRSGVDPEESAARATGTAGSAVVFAGLTVLIALIGLSFAGIPFLTTMGIAASAAVLIAVLVAVTLTPAFLGLVKGRVRGWAPRRARAPKDAGKDAAATRAPKERVPFSRRWVRGVTKHPVVTTVSVVLGLGIVAIPALSLGLALPNAGMLPEDNQARQSYDLVTEHFGPGFNGPLILTGTIVTSTDPVKLMNDLADEIAKVPGVDTIALATPNQSADTGIIQVIPTTAPDSPATAQLVRDLRAQHDRLLAEYGVDLKVTGFTAVAIDISDKLAAALIPFAIFVVGLSLILLTMVFRSVWVPIKATVGYLLSVCAAFGVVSAVFSWGWFAGPLHVSFVGPIISFMPILLMGVLFGLAMDYEVFLVSRMREDYVHRRRDHPDESDRTAAVGAIESGFVGSARVVTAAAVIMFAIFASFVPEGDQSIKPIALGLAAGVFFDAFIVRMTLVPAVMKLLGAHAWWIPRWLDRVLPHFDIEGSAVERELAMADWPEPRTTAAVVAADLALSEGDATLYRDVDLRVEPGGTLVVTSDDPRRTRALLLTIAGRAAPTDGHLKVAGHLLPGRSAWIRSHVGVALLQDGVDPVGPLRRALSGRARIVVIDGLDAATSGAVRDQVAATLRDAAPDELFDADAVTIIASAADASAAQSLLAEVGRVNAPVLTVAAAPVRRSPAAVSPDFSTSSPSEVTA